ncbi:unnamed protein product [Brachionus calyciflorus]|uniref:TATA element modulatory factor 1 TATA binding domain-containing protein n=1 Tax=Brachionus calyciflorus TaxID=104777 RepID=A0A813NR73_9BILA|nr:unnamed protein product [Brachionus calyciflorus]
MNRWFEAKNLSNYAKSALVQAQKKIDQVLDIKEEDIIAQSTTQITKSEPAPSLTPATTAILDLKSSSSSSFRSKDEDDSFFSSFLNQKKEPSFESFDINSSQTLQKSSNDEESVTESLASSIGTINNDDFKSKTRQNKKKQNQEQIEKQNWIQSFVDSSTDIPQLNREDTLKDSIEISTDKKTEEEPKSDFNKVEVNSGNASSNEEGLETCASSDIEVISLPSTTNTEFSSQNISKGKNVKQIFVKSPPPPIQPLTKADNSSQSKLNNDSKQDKAVLENREAQILKLNQQNVRIQEENDNLLSEIERLKQESNEKLQVLQRSLNEMNSKYQEVAGERDILKKGSGDLQKEYLEMKNLIKEKDLQIEELTQEGVKLSKQELNQSNIIKKLRAKEKETDEILTILKNDYQKAKNELDELKKILDSKEEAEIKNLELLKKLEKTALALEKELNSSKNALEDSEEKCKGLENNLQNTYKELAELHKKVATKETIINEATSSIESQLKEEIQLAVEKERITSNKKQEALKWELENLRQDLTRVEQQHVIREDMLRKEIADLQQQLRDSEMRNNELSQNISSATRPLLRQIENLQASHSSQIELLENAERNLIERLKETQANLCDITEKHRQNQEQVIDSTQKIKSLETQLQSLRADKSRINAEYQLCKGNLENYENEKLEKEAQTKALVTSLNQQVEALTKEKKFLERQLEIEKDKFENDTKKLQALVNECTKEKEILLQQQQLSLQSQSLNDSSSSLSTNPTRFSPLIDTQMRNSGLFNSMNNSNGAINVLEMLQSKLKQKEGEILHLQKEISNLERVRESMAKELVNLSNKLELLQEQSKEFPELKDNYDKLAIEYNALLTMYGEKTEENEELKMDLQDVKEMYKLQIEDLIKRSS